MLEVNNVFKFLVMYNFPRMWEFIAVKSRGIVNVWWGILLTHPMQQQQQQQQYGRSFSTSPAEFGTPMLILYRNSDFPLLGVCFI